MNEFTIERKAKAYDEAIKRAKALYDNDQPISGSNVIINNIFPELKESDDEGIRKGIIHNLKYLANKAQGFVKDELEERIAWLEKQVSVDEEKVLIGARKDIALSIMNFFNKNTLGMGLSNMECEDLEDAVVNSDWLKVYRYMKKKLEKQVEQKQDPCEHCDNVMLNCQNFPCIKKRAFEQGKSILEVINEEKVEPKYHEGDWVVSPNGVYWHIDRISNNRYEVTSNTGESSNWNLDTNIYHRFTIQDAKDGDVLVDAYGNIGIFEKRYGINWHTYCYLGNEGRFISEGGSHGSICYPATKEERDTLFTKMKEAGYEWDAEKLKLKKISQRMISAEAKEAMYGNSAWSEEDEKIRKELIKFVKVNIPNEERYITWLEKQKAIDVLDAEEREFADNVNSYRKDMDEFYKKGYDAGRESEKQHWLEEQGKPNPYSGVSFEYNGNTWGMCARDNGVDIHLNRAFIQHVSIEKQGEQKPAWSDEDEKMVNNILTPLAGRFPWNIYQPMYDWLKALKGRVGCEANCTTTKEWSVEDKSKVQRICKYLDEAKKYYADIIEVRECMDWLKSLEDRYTWKPSEKQMEALKEACDEHWEPDGLDPLYTLYQELKKLREE